MGVARYQTCDVKIIIGLVLYGTLEARPRCCSLCHAIFIIVRGDKANLATKKVCSVYLNVIFWQIPVWGDNLILGSIIFNIKAVSR